MPNHDGTGPRDGSGCGNGKRQQTRAGRGRGRGHGHGRGFGCGDHAQAGHGPHRGVHAAPEARGGDVADAQNLPQG